MDKPKPTPTSAHTLEIVKGADIFLGLNRAGKVKPDMIQRMAKDPLILALAIPTPEISSRRRQGTVQT